LAMVLGCANHTTEIYWFARSAAAAVAMYFE
jgi:hypothetical protein